jgi:hypothetical protein
MSAQVASNDVTISNKNDLNTRLNEIKESFGNYVSIRDSLANVEKGKVLQVDGKTIDGAYLKNMKESIDKSIMNLSKQVVPKKVKSETGAPKSRNSGFDNPVFVNKHVVKFFCERADTLGLDPKTRQALNALLPSLTKYELTTSSILTTLWTIYTNTQVDKITASETKVDPKTNKTKQVKYYKADDNMIRSFGSQGSNTFSRLSGKEAKTSKNGKVLEPFNPNKFGYTAWQSIYADNKLSAEKTGDMKLTADRDNLLKAMKEWKTLSHKAENELTPENKADLIAVNTRQIPVTASADKKSYLQLLTMAKAYCDQLSNERNIVAEALKVINESKPVAVKKSRTKAVTTEVKP